MSYDFFTISGLPCTWIVPASAKTLSSQNTGKIIDDGESSSGDPVNRSFNADVECRYTIEFTDLFGKVKLKSGIAKQGSNRIMVTVSSFKYGLYNVSVINNDTKAGITTKLVKG
jgi:hypothetical protein